MNNARRRREARARSKPQVVIAGAGIIAAELDHRYEARPHAELPTKQPGKHRWIATGAWVLNELAVTHAQDPDTRKFLDNENLMDLSIGCWDCEQPLGVITVDSVCPARGDN